MLHPTHSVHYQNYCVSLIDILGDSTHQTSTAFLCMILKGKSPRLTFWQKFNLLSPPLLSKSLSKFSKIYWGLLPIFSDLAGRHGQGASTFELRRSLGPSALRSFGAQKSCPLIWNVRYFGVSDGGARHLRRVTTIILITNSKQQV